MSNSIHHRDLAQRYGAPTLTKDYRHFIPGQPSVITEENWQTRNRLADKHYPQIFDLLTFPESHLVRILQEVELDKPLPRDLPVGPPESPRPLAILERRSWLEWHLFRGVAPDARRKKIPDWMRRRVLERDGLVCGICSGDVEPNDVHLDHIHPWSKGGQNTVENLRVTHSVCNMRKGARV